MKSQHKKITWLHLSDLHFKYSSVEVDNRQEILEEFWKDISAHIKQGLKPDFIAVTGDIAYSGNEKEYELAEKYFFQPLLKKVAKLPPEKMFVVPGNHDVNWDLPPHVNIEGMPHLYNHEKTYEFQSEPSLRYSVLYAVMLQYENFIKRYFGRRGSSDRDMLKSPLYAYVDTLDLENGISVALMGLNSAWWSAIVHKRMANQAEKDGDSARPSGIGDGEGKDSDGSGTVGNEEGKDGKLKITDRGKLLVGHKQVRDAKAKAKAKGADVRIALMHHPFEWLEEFDARMVRRDLRDFCHFILRGHLHEPEFIREIAWENESVCVIPAGTIDEDKELGSGYGYNLVQLDLSKGQGKAHFRCFQERNRTWSGGPMVFDLPEELRALADKES